MPSVIDLPVVVERRLLECEQLCLDAGADAARTLAQSDLVFR